PMPPGTKDKRKQCQRRAGCGEDMNRKCADVLESRHLTVAPVELYDLSRPSRQIPVAAEAAEARSVGTGDNDIRTDPVITVSDRYILARLFAPDGGDRPIDIFFDPDDARFPFGLIRDGDLMHPEKLSNEDRQQMRGAADTAGEYAGQALHRLNCCILVDE